MASRTKRVSMSLPQTLVDDLDYLAECMCVSRSTLVSVLLSRPMGNIASSMHRNGVTPSSDLDVSRRAVVQSFEKLEKDFREMKLELTAAH